MRRQDRHDPKPPLLPAPGRDLYLENLRKSYRIKFEIRRRDRLHGVLFLLALILALAVATLVWSVKAEGATTTPDAAAVELALVDWVRLAPRNPLRVASYRSEVARALVAGTEAHGLPVELVTAMTLRESSGAQTAVGARGEIGLMQVHPGTAALFHCRLDTPAEQVDCGCRVLEHHLRRCGTLRGAVSAYGSKASRCRPKAGSRLAKMVDNRFRLAAELRTVMDGETP